MAESISTKKLQKYIDIVKKSKHEQKEQSREMTRNILEEETKQTQENQANEKSRQEGLSKKITNME